MIARIPGACRVKDTHIESARYRRRITESKVLVRVPSGKAATVDRNAHVLKGPRSDVLPVEHVHVARIAELIGEPVARVVVAQNDEHVDPRVAEALHPLHEIEPGRIVPLVAVENVARQDDESAFLFDRRSHQIVERLAGRQLDLLGEISRLARQPDQRTIQVQVRSMKELESRHRIVSPPASIVKFHREHGQWPNCRGGQSFTDTRRWLARSGSTFS